MPPKYPNSDSQNQWEKMFFETIRDSLDDDVFCLSEFVLMGHKFKKYGKPDYVIVSKRGVFGPCVKFFDFKTLKTLFKSCLNKKCFP